MIFFQQELNLDNFLNSILTCICEYMPMHIYQAFATYPSKLQVNNCPLQDLVQLSPNIIHKYIMKTTGHYHNIAFDPKTQFTIHCSKDL